MDEGITKKGAHEKMCRGKVNFIKRVLNNIFRPGDLK
jgi:hypothetical protein